MAKLVRQHLTPPDTLYLTYKSVCEPWLCVSVYFTRVCKRGLCECVYVLIGGLLSWKIIHLSPSGPLAADTSHTLSHNHIYSQVNSTRTCVSAVCQDPQSLHLKPFLKTKLTINHMEAATQMHFNLHLKSHSALCFIFLQSPAWKPLILIVKWRWRACSRPTGSFCSSLVSHLFRDGKVMQSLSIKTQHNCLFL